MESIFPTLVRCERDQTTFKPRIRSYPPGAAFPTTDYDPQGDRQLNCPKCGRGYMYHADSETWQSDRPLTILK